MPNESREPDAIDRWLRSGLEPDPEASQRVARQALSGAPMQTTLGAGRWAALAAGALAAGTMAAAILVPIWTRGGSAPAAAREPIRITNHGELVTAIEPSGEAWLLAPVQVVDHAAPRLIITLRKIEGEADAD